MSFHNHDEETIQRAFGGRKQQAPPYRIPAEHARISAAAARAEAAQAELKNLPGIYDEIQKAAAEGKHSTFLYRKLNDKETAVLQADGYAVKQEWDQREQGHLVTVSWEEVEGR